MALHDAPSPLTAPQVAGQTPGPDGAGDRALAGLIHLGRRAFAAAGAQAVDAGLCLRRVEARLAGSDRLGQIGIEERG